MDANNHKHFLLDTRPSRKRSTLAVFRFGLPLPREFLLGELEPEPFSLSLWIHVFSCGRVSFHTLSFESIDLSSSIACNLHNVFFLSAWTYLQLQQRQRRAGQVVFYEKRNASHDLFVRRTGPTRDSPF